MSGPTAGAGSQPRVGSGSIPVVTSSGTVSGTVLTAPMIPLMARLSLPDFNQLINDPIHHDADWAAMPTNLPSDILKFEGNAGENPTNHCRSFHMWCSSNSITDDSICLRLFERTLTGDATKWYVDQPSASHSIFAMLTKAFLSYFRLPFWYDIGTELLTSFCQSSATRLSDHVQEWRRRRSTCRDPPFEDRIYLDWFLRSLLAPIGKDVVSPIGRDVTSHFPRTKEEAL